MYAALAQAAQPAAPLVACHLRAAPIMRPGVPQRLGSVLSDVHQALEDLVTEERL